MDGEPLMMRSDKAPVDWVTIDHPAMNRAMVVGKIGKEGVLLTKVPVKVHPEIAKEVKIIFDKPFSCVIFSPLTSKIISFSINPAISAGEPRYNS